MLIGEVLKRTRAIAGYKAKEMSSMLGISNSYLSEIENNHKKPSIELLEKYSDILEIKLSSLILLSEKFEEESKKNNGKEFIRKKMIRLIEVMSSNEEEEEDEK